MRIRFAAILLLALVFVVPAGAVPLPGPTPAEVALTTLPEFPNAPAVVLERRGTMTYNQQALSSTLEIYQRLKVLNQEGTSYGSIAIVSSDFFRAKGISARTHLPDGRVVELPKDAKFERSYSDYYDTTVRTCALPEVVPGAIVEYGYTIYFDSLFFPTPWYFQSEIPTLLSSITFDMPKGIGFAPVQVQTLTNVPFEEDTHETVSGRRASYTMRNLPPVPDEPDSFPFSALSSRVLMLPVVDWTGGMRRDLLSSWENVAELVWGGRTWGYLGALRDSGDAEKTARQLASGLGSDREKAEALYRFVRDEVDLDSDLGIWVGDVTVDKVLSERKGDEAEQALVLYAMLDALKLKPQLGWTADRRRVYVQRDVPDPAQLDMVLVVLDLPEGRVFLDPSDRSAAFGMLDPDYQGVPCLVVSRKQQEWTVTPKLDPDTSARVATIDLAVDEEGALAGTGSLHLTGNHAWTRLMWKSTAAEAEEAWQDWLEDAFTGYDVTDLKVTEEVEKVTVDVTWTLRERAEEVLGDEASLRPARPFVAGANPYALDPSQRRTPLQLHFADTDRVELTLSWPDGWLVETVPPASSHSGPTGSYDLEVEVDAAARTARVHRSLRISGDQFLETAAYTSLRDLLRAAVDGDAGVLLLVRE